MNHKKNINDLIAIMAKLRDPDGGCPWDLEQDFKSIVAYTIEEAYEVADAIDRGDMNDLRGELGDLLFQSVYHAQMASEAGHFDLHDVIHDITNKMIARHPHVFGDEDAKSASDVSEIWERRKAEEKSVDSSVETSALDNIPNSFPALLRAQKQQKKAAKVGFEWRKMDDVFDKLQEELDELREAYDSGNIDHQEDELGDVLFVLVNFARLQGINAEEALRRGCNKFEQRFRGMEVDFKAGVDGINDISEASLTQMTQMWKSQKAKEPK